jgi:thiosulfate/3-mercaptopyruvate sulfurtransferase
VDPVLRSREVDAWASDDLIEVEELAESIGDESLRIVDCRFAFDRDMREDYRAGHIPGAVYCSWADDLSDPPTPVRWQIASPQRFAAAMSRLGIGDDTSVVAYDAEGGHHAARLWWALRYYGHDAVAILHGGIQAWTAAGHALEAGEPRPHAARFTPRPRPELRATKDEVLAAVGRGEPVLLDVRRESEYTGAEARSARGGHIPGARHLEWRTALTPEWRLRPREEVRRLYEERGIGQTSSAITYCHAGVRAAFSAFVLTLLGGRDVKVYDGSWEEWGNDPALPLETGAPVSAAARQEA